MVAMNYQESLEWIHSIGKSAGIRPGLERMKLLLNKMGNPEKRLTCIHIGGTNGKGSTANMLAAVLEATGCRVGLYTSPYLEAFTNRMSINGVDIKPQELVQEVNRLRPLVEEISKVPGLGSVTEFEVVTALAFRYFASHQPDLVILEVGLGGRYDATNVITPLASVITNVSREHMDYLGDTLQEIAWQKAGIIKPRVPVITAARQEEVLEVIEQVSKSQEAPLIRVVEGEEMERLREKDGKVVAYSQRQVFPQGQQFKYLGCHENFEKLFIPLKGKYQILNATTALAVLDGGLGVRRYRITPERVIEGLHKVKWPGRLEVLNSAPQVVLDGAHNPDAAENLCQAVQEHFSYDKLVLVLGILKDKDAAPMLKTLLPLAEQVIITLPPVFRGADPQAIAQQARDITDSPVEVYPQISDAVERSLEVSSGGDMVLICGSLYVIAEARKIWIDQFSNNHLNSDNFS